MEYLQFQNQSHPVSRKFSRDCVSADNMKMSTIVGIFIFVSREISHSAELSMKLFYDNRARPRGFKTFFMLNSAY